MILHFPWHLLRQISLPAPYFNVCATMHLSLCTLLRQFLWEKLELRKVLGIAQCLGMRIPRGFSLVLKANIIGTQLIPKGCGGLSNFLQELDWKLLQNSQFSVWPVLPWELLAAWLSNVMINLFTKSLEQLLSVVIQKQIPIYYHRCWGDGGKIGRYLEDEMWGRNSSSGGSESETIRWRKLPWWGLKEGMLGTRQRLLKEEMLQRSHYGSYSWRKRPSREVKRWGERSTLHCWLGMGGQGTDSAASQALAQEVAPSPGPALYWAHTAITSHVVFPFFCITDCLLNIRYILNKIINPYSRSCCCPTHTPSTLTVSGKVDGFLLPIPTTHYVRVICDCSSMWELLGSERPVCDGWTLVDRYPTSLPLRGTTLRRVLAVSHKSPVGLSPRCPQ